MTRTETVSRSAFAAAIGVSPQMVSRYIAAGLPRLPDGRLDPAAAHAWLEENRVSPDTTTGQGYALSKAKLEAAKAGLAELELAAKSAKTLDAAEVRQLLSTMVIQVRDGVMALPGLLCDRLATMSDPIAISLLLEAEIRRILQRFADAAERDLGAEVPTDGE